MSILPDIDHSQHMRNEQPSVLLTTAGFNHLGARGPPAESWQVSVVCPFIGPPRLNEADGRCFQDFPSLQTASLAAPRPVVDFTGTRGGGPCQINLGALEFDLQRETRNCRIPAGPLKKPLPHKPRTPLVLSPHAN